MKNFQSKHANLLKEAQINDIDYASLSETEGLQELLEIVLETEEKELKKIVELQSCDKDMVPYYKKNLKLFAEFYLTDRDNRNKVIAIKEKDSKEKS